MRACATIEISKVLWAGGQQRSNTSQAALPLFFCNGEGRFFFIITQDHIDKIQNTYTYTYSEEEG